MEKQNDRDGLATQKLGEDYVDLTVCENRCLRNNFSPVLYPYSLDEAATRQKKNQK